MTQSPKIYLYRRVVNAKLYIDQHYEENLNLDDISSEASFSKFHFLRIFKKTYGKTPHQYLTWIRMEKAKILLQRGHKIAYVCFAVGFESISTFTALFKKVAGQSPAFYQQVQQEGNKQMTEAPLKFIPNCFAQNNGWANNSNIQ